MGYTTIERAARIYSTVAEIFNYDKNSDVVTPLEVVRKQVCDVRSTDKVCIPGAGIGTYVFALIERGVAPENIVAVELDSRYYELGSSMFERLGVKYIHADFLSWEPEMRFDVIVGNPPYTDTTTVQSQVTGGCSKGLDNVFFERCMELAPYVSLVIRSKHFAKKGSKFRKKLFASGHVKEIEALPADVFPSISLTETCVVTYDCDHGGPTKVTFQGGSCRDMVLDQGVCVKLTNPSFEVDVVNNMAYRYERGNFNLNQLVEGDSPMVITMGAKGKEMVVQKVAKEQAVCGVNQHGVVMNSKYGGKGFGKVCVKPFSHAVSGSAIILKTSCEEESLQLRDYLLSDAVQDLVGRNKISNANTKELFSTIPDIDFKGR
jgi:predicted RNA methylase